jgi:hypothetical protein
MSNRPPLDLADRLCCVDPDEIRETMTPRQAIDSSSGCALGISIAYWAT